ncbi:unnamed protein product, partial [Allacma fusca]
TLILWTFEPRLKISMERPLNIDDDLFEPETFANNERKKRKRDPSEWSRTKAKKARVSGTEFKNPSGQTVVKQREMRRIDCICGCSESISEVEKDLIFESFCGKGSHEIQNEYLRGCTEVIGVDTLSNGTRRRTFIHKLHFQYKTVHVCQKFFLAIHGINRSRLRKKVLHREVDIEDRRGKHPNHPMKTTYATRDLMRIFFKSLPARHSHYSVNKNPNRLYMDSHWTVTALFERFLHYFPDVTRKQATLTVFRHIFNNEFNIKFGCPRTDKCDTCSKFLTSLNSLRTLTPNDVDAISGASILHEQHLEYADIFYRDMASAKLFPDNHFALCMDFQQNIPLPVTRINKEFYLRQLWIFNFGIKNIKTGETTMFLYSETFAKKGANEVISCLLWYVDNVVPPNVTTLSVFCDNPAGQNKNRFLFAALQHLANSRFERLYVKYPIPGHSRMPIDADFGLIEVQKRRMEHLYYPSDIVNMVKSARVVSPFNIVYVNMALTNDLCDDDVPCVLVRDYKLVLAPLFRTTEVGGMNLRSVRELRFFDDSFP